MSERIFGYVRVSTKEQNLDRQLLAMREYGISEKLIYQDKLSGRDFERPAYRLLLKKLRPGDTLVIKSIDRLGRNYDEILEQWQAVSKESELLTRCVGQDVPEMGGARRGLGRDTFFGSQ